jgi:hypothetical protein
MAGGGAGAACLDFSHCGEWSSCTAKTLTPCEHMELRGAQTVCEASLFSRRSHAVTGQQTEDGLSNAPTKSSITAGFHRPRTRNAD